jgi:hypothetical protein
MASPESVWMWYNSTYVQCTSPSIKVDALDPSLVRFLTDAGKVHTALFRIALEITSGNDGNHVAGSAHYKNKAADLRCLDLLDAEQTLFGLVLGHCARVYRVAVFDERFTASPHWHVQTADSVGG